MTIRGICKRFTGEAKRVYNIMNPSAAGKLATIFELMS